MSFEEGRNVKKLHLVASEINILFIALGTPLLNNLCFIFFLTFFLPLSIFSIRFKKYATVLRQGN
jgi:hypothetical protein